MNRAQVSLLTAAVCLAASAAVHGAISDTVYKLFATSTDAACVPDRTRFSADPTARGNIAGDWVAVRAGPGTACELLSSPNNQQNVDVLGAHGDFYALRYQWGGEMYYGWAAKQNVRLGERIVVVDSAAQAATALGIASIPDAAATGRCAGFKTPEPLNERGVVAISSGRLNVRSGPSTRCRILDALADESVVHVVGRSDNWYEVTYDSAQIGASVRGWLSGDYLEAR